MLKKLAIIFATLAIVLAVACGGSDKGSSNSDKTDNDSTPVATKKASSTKAAPTKEATEEVTATDEAGGDSAGALESLSFLTGGMFGGSQTGAPEAADQRLSDMLIASTDLPSTFASVGGDVGFSTTMPQGEAKMAMRTFSEGDPNMSQMTPTVISGAISMPPAALDEFDSQLAQLDKVSAEDIQNAMGGSAMLGIEFKELSVDKVSLGDGGITMHMVMDMSGLIEGLGDLAPEGTGDFPTSLTFDMYVFKKGDVVLMAMTMLPPDQTTSVDVESLANIMESRAP